MINTKVTIATLLILALLTGESYSLSAGVSPPKIFINNVTSNNLYNLTFVVYNMGNETTNYTIAMNGEISKWITLDKTSVQVEGNGKYKVTGKIKTPTLKNESYTGNVLIKSVPVGSTSFGNTVSVGVMVPVTLNTSKAELESTEKTKLSGMIVEFILFVVMGAMPLVVILVIRRLSNKPK